MISKTFTLGEIASHLGADLHGDGQLPIRGLATLRNAKADQLSFLANSKYAKDLQDTHAGAVIIGQDLLGKCPTNALVLANPYLGYARISHWFVTDINPPAGIHPSAVIASSASIDPSASIGANVVIGEAVMVGANTIIGAGCSVGTASIIGDGCHLMARVTLYSNVRLGNGVLVHSGAVIGSDGFGFAPHQGRWIKIAQLGGVEIGDDVEIGANTTIDSGALEPTRLGNGVKIDNQVQVAHNVQIGDFTAIAGCVGIAGSAIIGKHCTLGGGVGVAGHLEIGDNVHITGMSLVSASIREPGVYSSGTALTTNAQWRKNVARFRNLDDIAKRVKQLEKKLHSNSEDKGSLDDGN
ncbi:UDP-3-O-(3-hydroxymyristoyl) glucosamine N-acyltransferase [Pokkaliibacter plantistimulans]|uniref:UDP-3-O-acylglucosamine N-acyltransferase n=1 Tax=Pokkaliibacter plantistimulans TaxID=1635171 RepID=A0ABX5M7N3_9GAMM|nr:UDP-3-O-(3-hydroxymyristoyl) glucosamine N-acyltransferase [Pokkaliibacter plantistimulans]